MKQIHPLLFEAQRADTVEPAIKVSIGDYTFTCEGFGKDGKIETCHNTSNTQTPFTIANENRIYTLEDNPEKYRHTAKMLLNNADGLLDGVPFVGEWMWMSWGAMTSSGAKYATHSPVLITTVSDVSAEGILSKQIEGIGPFDIMAQHRAVKNYKFDNTVRIYTMISMLLEGTLTDVFPDCPKFNYVYDDVPSLILDTIYTLMPGDAFEILVGDSLLDVIISLLSATAIVLREGDEKFGTNASVATSNVPTFHFYLPTKKTEHDYVYSLNETEHKYKVVSSTDNLVVPNKFTVETPYGNSPIYTGSATESRSYNANKNSVKKYFLGLQSNAHCNTVASIMLANAINYANGSYAEVPMNCGQQLYDDVLVKDQRGQKELAGNVAVINRKFDALKAEYSMKISYGNWFESRKINDPYAILETNDGHTIGKTKHVTIMPWAYTSSNGTWTNLSGITYSCTTDGAYLKYTENFEKGTFNLSIPMPETTGEGIVDILIDDVLLVEWDLYVSPSLDGFQMHLTQFVISDDGDHTIKILVNGKNASSSGYRCWVAPISIWEA